MCSYFQQLANIEKSERYVKRTGGWQPAPKDGETKVIRPTVEAVTVTAESAQPRHWALVPFWAKESKLKYATFNARGESLCEKPAYRDAWKRSQRCLIPAVSYSEWLVVNGKKARHNIAMEDGSELMIAGLWSDWHEGQEDQRKTFTMITTSPLDQISWVHNRSPLMLSPGQWDQWLTGAPDECAELLEPNDPGSLAVELAG